MAKGRENVTRPRDEDPAAFVAAVEHPTRRADAEALLELMREATGEEPVMWGPSIVGFGSYHYRYASGREGDMPRVGFAPRKASLVFYGLQDAPEAQALIARLGKHELGKGCLYVTKLADVDRDVLRALIELAHRHERGGG